MTNRRYVSTHSHCLFICKNDKKRKFFPYERFDKDEKDEKGGSFHYQDKEDVWQIKREYWNGEVKTPTKLPAEIIKTVVQYSSETNDSNF